MHYLFPILEAFSCIVDSWNRKFLVHKDVNKNHNSFFRDLGMTPSKEDPERGQILSFLSLVKIDEQDVSRIKNANRETIAKPGTSNTTTKKSTFGFREKQRKLGHSDISLLLVYIADVTGTEKLTKEAGEGTVHPPLR